MEVDKKTIDSAKIRTSRPVRNDFDSVGKAPKSKLFTGHSDPTLTAKQTTRDAVVGLRMFISPSSRFVPLRWGKTNARREDFGRRRAGRKRLYVIIVRAGNKEGRKEGRESIDGMPKKERSTVNTLVWRGVHCLSEGLLPPKKAVVGRVENRRV